MYTINGFANNKIKGHNGTSRITSAIALHRRFSHIDKNCVMSPKNLNIFTNF